MKKKIIFYGIAFSIIISSCVSLQPKDFTYRYDDKYIGLDTIVDLQGYYITQRGCDTTFHSAFIFYPNGLFLIATGTNLNRLTETWRRNDTQSTISKYPSWGTYVVSKDTIKTQTIRQEGIGFCTIFRDYLILADKSIVNISDYVLPENTNIGYMANYPSVQTNPCPSIAQFYSLSKLPDVENCPYLTKDWFNSK